MEYVSGHYQRTRNGATMIDIALHRRCMSQPVRERRLMSVKIKHWAANQPSDQYIAPELVEEIMEMRVPMPDKARRLGAGTLPNETTISREAYWNVFAEWMRASSK